MSDIQNMSEVRALLGALGKLDRVRGPKALALACRLLGCVVNRLVRESKGEVVIPFIEGHLGEPSFKIRPSAAELEGIDIHVSR